MKKKIAFSFIITTILVVGVFTVMNSGMISFRPMNQREHPGLTSPFHPSGEGADHRGAASDYTPRFSRFWSELCELDKQFRPANQGFNIPKFFNCGSDYCSD